MARFASLSLALSCFFIALAAPASTAAQETRVAGADHTPPAAAIEQLDWLVGSWSGSGINGGQAHETWLPATGDTMVGVFVQEEPGGGIMFTEHMYIREVDGSVQMDLKHFNADLTAWEDRDEMVTFRLIALEHCAAYFSALTIRCANGANGDDGLVVAVRMQSEGDDIEELLFDFARVETGADYHRICADAETTVDLNGCYSAALADAQTRREAYLAAAIERNAQEPAIAEQIASADNAYDVYVDAECGAISDYWSSGTIRGVMVLTCRIDLIDRATRNIWQHWLTYMDSTPPVLPEPAPTM